MTPLPPEVLALRLKLMRGGYTPLPLFGKEPPVYGKNNKRKGFKNWQNLNGLSQEQVEMWGKLWPGAINTGVLTRSVPTFDADILNPEAACAVEELVREHYEERGHLMVRIGLPPKRAFLFRTDRPFDKININFDRTKEKLEFLCDGQQLVVSGIHPDTSKPYAWFGGEPEKVRRDELPAITQAEAAELMERAAKILVADYGYVRAGTTPASPGPDAGKPSRSDAEIMALLEATRTTDQWHDPMLRAVASMIGRGWASNIIRMMCTPYCRDGYDDRDLDDLIDGARAKWGVPNEEQEEPAVVSGNDIARLNAEYAVLPIGGKTRVVKFGEMDEFPGRETIVMTQTIGDFAALNNKYRHVYLDKKGEMQTIPMGSYWVQNQKRRQYDGGMAFMPNHDGDAVNRLNLWRGFGIKPVKGDCSKFLDFMCDIICSSNEEHFDYLIQREATILQKRIRSEVALGLKTKEEGCGKGFYEKTMRHLLGTHAMQLGNPEHIIGKFNPHLETLLRLTADEALFVGDPKHRNALFGLITEPTLTIEPKNCGVYTANSYLNLSITTNSEHFIPVSDTARRFFVPTVSAARKQDHEYFAGLQAELDGGGYEALLHHLLFGVDLTGFNVRKVPQTEELRQQRDLSLPALEAWWVELLETGTLWGADPAEPQRAVSNSYQREVWIGEYPRHVTQPGVFDQARKIEPRLRNFTSDHRLGHFLSEMGCDNNKKVLRKQGWTFPPLKECRAAWEARYPGWKWRNPDLGEWQAEEGDDEIEGGFEVTGRAEHFKRTKAAQSRSSRTFSVPLTGEAERSGTA